MAKRIFEQGIKVVRIFLEIFRRESKE